MLARLYGYIFDFARTFYLRNIDGHLFWGLFLRGLIFNHLPVTLFIDPTLLDFLINSITLHLLNYPLLLHFIISLLSHFVQVFFYLSAKNNLISKITYQGIWNLKNELIKIRKLGHLFQNIICISVFCIVLFYFFTHTHPCHLWYLTHCICHVSYPPLFRQIIWHFSL